MDKLLRNQPPLDKIDSHAAGINVDAIMATIRSQPEQAQGLPQTTHFREVEDVHYPEESLDDEQPLLYFLLREMSQTHPLQRQIEPDLTASRLDKLPLVSSLWNILRRQLHGLSIFYANKVAEQMISYHQYTNIVLNLMIRQDQKRNSELTKLKQHVADLEARLARLEHKS